MGFLRHELVLTLLGAVLLSALVYSFSAILALTLIHHKRAGFLSARMSPESVQAENQGAVFCLRKNAGEEKFFRLPGVLIRYEIRFFTKDGRILYHLFDPDVLKHNMSLFKAPKRGAYYGPQDRLLILDIFGFFLAAFALPQEPGARFLALPQAAAKPVAVEFHSGGAEQRSEPHFLRTDNLVDHRPYIPGDDPRRINWKLYSHAGDLFVREGEREPPPHSKLTLLVDTQIDTTLFAAGRFTGQDRTAEAALKHNPMYCLYRGVFRVPPRAGRAVDLLCENALALVMEYSGRGLEIAVGYTGGKAPREGGPAELAAALAYPAALPLNSPPSKDPMPELPDASEDRAVLVLALPRSGTPAEGSPPEAANSALDRFLNKRGKERETDILFLYEGENLDEAAEICAHFYARKAGVRTRRIKLG
jgi:hypothetical protein